MQMIVVKVTAEWKGGDGKMNGWMDGCVFIWSYEVIREWAD